ncbi:hypothetical protein JCM1841_002405 [Sporobolomyces salmonicolor]
MPSATSSLALALLALSPFATARPTGKAASTSGRNTCSLEDDRANPYWNALLLRDVWGSDNRTAARTYAGIVRNNAFQSGSTGYFSYAVAIAGHENVTVYGNDASGANFGGDPSTACMLVPMNNFQDHQLITVFLICPQSGAIMGSGTISAGASIMLWGFGAINVSVSSISTSVSSTISTTTFRWPGFLLLLSQTWTKVTFAVVKPERRTISQLVTLRYEKPTIIQDGNDDDPFVNDRDEAVVGYVKPPPVVTLVNPSNCSSCTDVSDDFPILCLPPDGSFPCMAGVIVSIAHL